MTPSNYCIGLPFQFVCTHFKFFIFFQYFVMTPMSAYSISIASSSSVLPFSNAATTSVNQEWFQVILIICKYFTFTFLLYTLLKFTTTLICNSFLTVLSRYLCSSVCYSFLTVLSFDLVMLVSLLQFFNYLSRYLCSSVCYSFLTICLGIYARQFVTVF